MKDTSSPDETGKKPGLTWHVSSSLPFSSRSRVRSRCGAAPCSEIKELYMHLEIWTKEMSTPGARSRGSKKQNLVGHVIITRSKRKKLEEHSNAVSMLMAQRRRDVNCNIDHLSDDILLRILSFLPSKEAGRSSILSGRWRDVWSGLPCLDFDERDFTKREREFRCTVLRDEKFLIHVPSALKRHKGTTIRKFQLLLINFERPKVNNAVKKWIPTALSKKVQELHLDFSSDQPSVCSYGCRYRRCHSGYPKRRDCIFDLRLISERSLRTLSLKGCFVDIPNAIDLRLLESLSLTAVHLKQRGLQHLIKCLISGCPLLKNLELQGYEVMEDEDGPIMENIEFSCPHLRSMKLRCCHGLRSVEIDAPILQYFEYEGDLSVHKLNLVSSQYLTNAKISICKRAVAKSDYRLTRLRDFISKFVHVRFLEVNPYSIEDLMITRNIENGRPSLFHELKRLELVGEVCENKSIVAITSFLGIALKLEHLVLFLLQNKTKLQNHHDPDEVDLQELQNNSPISFPNNLKRVRIENFAGTESESKLVKYVLRRAVALEELIVQGAELCFPEHLKIKEKLSSWKINPSTKITYC